MNKIIKTTVIFVTGAAVGAIPTYILTKKKVEKHWIKECEFVRSYYAQNANKTYSDPEPLAKPEEKTETATVRTIDPNKVIDISNKMHDYTKHASIKRESVKEPTPPITAIDRLEELKKKITPTVGQTKNDEDFYHQIDPNEAGDTDNEVMDVTYYAGSGDLVETMSGDILSIYDAIGPNGENVLSDIPEDVPFGWRNDFLGFDYIIDPRTDIYIQKEIEND